MQSQESFTIEVSTFEQGRILSLHGYLDASTSSVLDEHIQECLNNDSYVVIIDCEHLSYISSAGLGIFMKHIDAIRKQGGDIVFCCMQKPVFTVFDLLGFPILYRIVADKSSAMSLFSRGDKS